MKNATRTTGDPLRLTRKDVVLADEKNFTRVKTLFEYLSVRWLPLAGVKSFVIGNFGYYCIYKL